jgi:hypothetical protein
LALNNFPKHNALKGVRFSDSQFDIFSVILPIQKTHGHKKTGSLLKQCRFIYWAENN